MASASLGGAGFHDERKCCGCEYRATHAVGSKGGMMSKFVDAILL